MSKPRQHCRIAFGSLAFLLFAIGLAQAGETPKQETPKHRHAATTTRHAATDAWRHSYARMPATPGIPHEDDIPALSPAVSPNLFETGHPPGQPGPMH